MKKEYFSQTVILTCCFLLIQTFIFAQRDLYLVIGQSNTAGRGVIEAEDMVALTGVDLFNGTTWESAINNSGTNGGLNRYSTVAKVTQDQGLNFAYTFGRTLNEVTGNQIGLVVNAIGGTKITEWQDGAPENYFGEAIAQTNAALALGGSTLKGIIWHQGESNRNRAAYLSDLATLVASLRTALGDPNLPFIAGQLSNQRTDNETFNTNIKKIADSGDANYIANTDYVLSDGLSTEDRTHFISNSQRVLGYRYAAKTLKNIYGYTYVENQIIYVDEDAYVRSGTHADDIQQSAESDLVRIKETSTNADNTRRGLLKFDISSLTGLSNRLIIDTSLIINADLDDGDAGDSTVPTDFSFYDIPTSWSENTVTFNNAPSFSTPISSSALSFFIDGVYQRGADITEYIKDEYDNGTTTVALGIKSETDGTPQLKISTKEDATNFALRPYLLYSYIDTSIVTDTEDPTIACPSNIVQGTDTGEVDAVVNYATPTSSDNVGVVSTTQTAGLASGATFPIGITTNTFVVADAAGNSTTCSFTVTINDGTLTIEDVVSPLEPVVKVYPNPFVDNYTLKLSNYNGQSAVVVELFSISGALISKRSYTQSIIEFKNMNLSIGVYALKVSYDGKSFMKKIIKY